MSTDDDKVMLAKLLHNLEVPDVKLSERCSDLVKNFHEKYSKEVEEEEEQMMNVLEDIPQENPYKVDKVLLEENERKLKNLLEQSKRTIEQLKQGVGSAVIDPKRPWRTHSTKERLLRINKELDHYHEKSSQSIDPLGEDTMKVLLQQCVDENRSALPVSAEKLRSTIANAKKSLPNFQYRRVENSTAISILPSANESSGSDITTLPN